MAASDLAVPACRDAVADAGLTMDQIDLVIMNTITPDHADPGCAFFLQAKLGLPGIPVFDIKQQCAGLIYGLALADHFVRAGTYRHVLVVCAEVLSGRIDGSYDGRNIAILLGRRRGRRGRRARRRTGSAASFRPSCTPTAGRPRPSIRRPRAADSGRKEHITKDDIDAGRVHFRMDGKAIFQNGVEKMSEAVFESLKANGLMLDEIDVLVPHQANLRMLEAIVAPRRHPAGEGLCQRRGIRQHRLGLAAHRLPRSAAIRHDPPGQPGNVGGLRLRVRLGVGALAGVRALLPSPFGRGAGDEG